MVRFGTLSVDGTKVRAKASKRKAMSYGRMLKEEARLKEEIQRLLAQTGAVDAEEDERYGEQMRGDEVPAELWRILPSFSQAYPYAETFKPLASSRCVGGAECQDDQSREEPALPAAGYSHSRLCTNPRYFLRRSVFLVKLLFPRRALTSWESRLTLTHCCPNKAIDRSCNLLFW